ncbi:UNVERIFIED_ORG: catechol 2,3-dioxygenase-like lactoylglutathione lyase family enzyme [Ensifer adhaerens]|nr:catechol 2,3-dioxygenase-like lactoylglutathione lyase family enzyme [Ensifer adhaerens]
MASVRYIVADVDEAVAFYRDNLDFEVDVLIERLRRADARFRGEISDGGAGRAFLLEDPSGNVIELFEFKKD